MNIDKRNTLEKCGRPSLLDSENDVTNYMFLLNQTFRCQRNTRTEKNVWSGLNRCKNTNCNFEMNLKLHNAKYKKEQANGVFYNVSYPCEINLRYDHNHNTKVLQALSFRDVKQEAKEELF